MNGRDTIVTRHSPCVGICALDGTSDFCLGCARSRDEIAAWMTMSEAQRDAVWLELPKRLPALNIRVRLLPWTPGEIIGFVAETLTECRGTWSIGQASASATFPAAVDDAVEVEANGDTVIARRKDRALRIRIGDKVRAFGFAGNGHIALILPKARAKLSFHTQPSDATDNDAIDAAQRGQPIHDFDSQDQNVRVAVRSANFRPAPSNTAAPLRSLADLRFVPDDATIVWETAITRIEVRAASIEWQSATNSGQVAPIAASGRSQKAALPAYAAEVATFHPQNRPDG